MNQDENTLIKLLLRIVPALILCSLAGCESLTPKPPEPSPVIEGVFEGTGKAEAADRTTSAPTAMTTAPLPPVSVDIPEALDEVTPRFDIAVHNVPAAEFFMGLVEDTPFNILVHPSVTGTVSLTLKNVSIEETLDAVREVYGYEYHRKGMVYKVMPASMRSRIFKVDYLNIERKGGSRTRITSGEVSQIRDSSTVAGSASVVGDGRSRSLESLSGSQVTTTSETDLWRQMEVTLKTMIGEGDGRSVVVNPQAGIVVVRAMPEELRVVEEFLEALQNVTHRQVILEAKILEVRLNDRFRSGINWALVLTPGDHTIALGQTGGGTLLNNGEQLSDIAGQTGNLNPDNFDPIEGALASAFGGMFSIGLDFNDFTAFIELLKIQGNVQVLSSPRVATVNNQKAMIKVGEDEFFVTNIDVDTDVANDVINQAVDVDLTPFFSGVALDVTPQIDEDGTVILHIHPTVTEVIDQIKNISISTDNTLSVPLALSNTRETDTIIRAHSGQLVVIGGLMKNDVDKRTASTPLLGDLPMVGKLFRQESEFSDKTELVILLRPHVVDSGEVWTKALDETAERFRDFYQDGSQVSH